jgi:glyoxylase-like metal-dependent hydrolase (beta-lactamase superfamily II)
VDAGWPGTLPHHASRLKAYDLDLSAIRYTLPTHYHPDHAGLVQELKQAAGTRLIIHLLQIPYLPQLAEHFARHGGLPITLDPTDLILPADTRAALRALGLDAEVLPTPGHSPDSVSLVLAAGQAFTGDLPPPAFVAEDQAPLVRASWQALLDRGAHTFYPSHAAPVPAAVIRQQLS